MCFRERPTLLISLCHLFLFQHNQFLLSGLTGNSEYLPMLPRENSLQSPIQELFKDPVWCNHQVLVMQHLCILPRHLQLRCLPYRRLILRTCLVGFSKITYFRVWFMLTLPSVSNEHCHNFIQPRKSPSLQP